MSTASSGSGGSPSGSAPPPSPPTPLAGGSGSGGWMVGVIRSFIALALLIGVGVGILPNLPPGGLKIIGLVILGIIGLVVLLGIVGSSKGGVGGFTVILAMVAASALFVLWSQNVQKVQKKNSEQRREEQVILLPPPAPEPRQHFVVEAPVGQEIRIPIPMGFTCDTDPVEYGTNNVVWVRREGEERFKDWKGRPSGGAKKSWSNYKYLQSAGSVPVKVEVDIHPER